MYPTASRAPPTYRGRDPFPRCHTLLLRSLHIVRPPSAAAYHRNSATSSTCVFTNNHLFGRTLQRCLDQAYSRICLLTAPKDSALPPCGFVAGVNFLSYLSAFQYPLCGIVFCSRGCISSALNLRALKCSFFVTLMISAILRRLRAGFADSRTAGEPFFE